MSWLSAPPPLPFTIVPADISGGVSLWVGRSWHQGREIKSIQSFTTAHHTEDNSLLSIVQTCAWNEEHNLFHSQRYYLLIDLCSFYLSLSSKIEALWKVVTCIFSCILQTLKSAWHIGGIQQWLLNRCMNKWRSQTCVSCLLYIW